MADYTITPEMVKTHLQHAGIAFNNLTTSEWQLTIGMEIEVFLTTNCNGKLKMLTNENTRNTIVKELGIQLGKIFCANKSICPFINKDGAFKFVDTEYWVSLIEIGTVPSLTISEQNYYFRTTMRTLIEICGKYNVYPMSVSTPVNKQLGWRHSSNKRYGYIKKLLGNAMNNFKVAGTQSQVYIPNDDIRVIHTRPAMNMIPIATALTASSPIFMGEYQHMQACRYSKWRKFPRTGIPEDEVNLTSAAGFNKYLTNVYDVVEAKVPGFLSQTKIDNNPPDILKNASRVYWAPVRPNQVHKTGEFRAAETTPYINDSILVTAMYRAFTRYIIRNPEYEIEDKTVLKINISEAEKNGIHGTFYNDAGNEVSFDTYLQSFITLISEDAKALGDLDFINKQVAIIKYRGTAADKIIEKWYKHKNANNSNEVFAQETMQWLIDETKKEAFSDYSDFP